MCFAVKELRVTRGLREAVALKRLHDKQHPHVIRLLATYTYNDRFNLIFPWADGNLKEFWEKRSPQLQGEHSRTGPVTWMSEQILGLSRALESIHYCKIDRINSHGDLKPENILWYKDEHTLGQSSMGVLKIGDFGFADFHSEHSKSNVNRSAVEGVTDTYSAPEYDVVRLVSPQFDIWSFGCILLQFVVWFIDEWDGIEEFSKVRVAESTGFLFPSDNFYSLHTGSTHDCKAQVKASVLQVSALGLQSLPYLTFFLPDVRKIKRA
jgi:serine/threonine protein kinase